METRADVLGTAERLSALSWEGGEPGFLLLHGAAGQAGEWRSVAGWLSGHGRVLALDLRGHGDSELGPSSVELDALVDDACAAARSLGRAPVVVAQSLGGTIAIALAARARALVRALAVVEASPSPNPDAAREVRGWLDRWPSPFARRADAEAFFGAGQRGSVWADGLEETRAGLVSRFDPEVVEAAVRAVTAIDLWDDWRRIACLILVVRGGLGYLSLAEAERMAAVNPRASVVTVDAAGHDVHLDDPLGFRAALEPFAARVVR